MQMAKFYKMKSVQEQKISIQSLQTGFAVKSFRYNLKTNPDSWQQAQNISIGKYLNQGKKNIVTVAVHDSGGMGGIWKNCYYKIIKNIAATP
ncbi:MAG: hypothetical protein A2020_08295 [Lentisphaerae bacterium GWF2_45_14]|nr:MAG: hypothetical protein A2020_08295 [Lentisphaerae bacterium GWF2_45_14]